MLPRRLLRRASHRLALGSMVIRPAHRSPPHPHPNTRIRARLPGRDRRPISGRLLVSATASAVAATAIVVTAVSGR